MVEDIWDELVEKYDISGYTNTLITIKYETFKKLHKKAEKWDGLKNIVPKLEERLRLLGKLEAVKEIVFDVNATEFHKVDRLKEILEAKG